MPDYNYSDFDDQTDEPSTGGGAPMLPGGISVQAAATGLLIVVLLAILWLFFGPTGDEPADLATATPGVSTTATAPVIGGAGGTAVVGGAPMATAAASVAPASLGTVPPAGAPTAGGVASGVTGTVAVPTSAAGTLPTSGVPAVATVASANAAALAAGGFVKVTNTDGYGMRFRFGPGLDNATIRIVDEGAVLKVMGDPESNDGVTWYRLQDEQGNVGWAAQTYLVATAAPAGWNPPVASPTFESDG